MFIIDLRAKVGLRVGIGAKKLQFWGAPQLFRGPSSNISFTVNLFFRKIPVIISY